MIQQMLDIVVLIWLLLAFIAFLIFVVAFSRLYAQAWKMPDHWQAIWKVTNIKPRRNGEWPNAAPETKLIVWGALMGVMLFTTALLFIILVLIKH